MLLNRSGEHRRGWRAKCDAACLFPPLCSTSQLFFFQLLGFRCEDTSYVKEAQLVNNTKGQLSSSLAYSTADRSRGLLRALCLCFAPFINTGFHVLKSQHIHHCFTRGVLKPPWEKTEVTIFCTCSVKSLWMSAFISSKRYWPHSKDVFSFSLCREDIIAAWGWPDNSLLPHLD